MKRVRTKSSDIAGNMEPPKKSKETTNGKRSPSPKNRRSNSPKESLKPNGKLSIMTHPTAKLNLKIVSHGRVNGPLRDPDDGEEMLRFTVRDVPNPPAKLRKKFTGLSPRLRSEIFSEKVSRLKYDTIVAEIERMMTSMETAVKYDALHPDEANEDTPTILIVSIQCEEGRHRSVSFAEELAHSDTTKRNDWAVTVEHRDLGVAETGGVADDDDSEEPTSPSAERPDERVRYQKKKDKVLKKARERRLKVEVADSGAEDGFY